MKTKRMLSKLSYVEQFLIGSSVLVNGIPKCGTNLLRQTVINLSAFKYDGWVHYFGLPDDKVDDTVKKLEFLSRGGFLTGHVVPEENIVRALVNKNFRSMLIIRDPRAYVVSYMYHILKLEHHRFHDYLHSISQEKRLLNIIQGIPADFAKDSNDPLPGVLEMYSLFAPWFNYEFNLVIHFEHLIGKYGGGTQQKQFDTVLQIHNHLKLRFSEKRLRQICDLTFNTNSVTFRRGQIDDWVTHFSNKEKSIFKERAGELLIQLGYEDDFNW